MNKTPWDNFNFCQFCALKFPQEKKKKSASYYLSVIYLVLIMLFWKGMYQSSICYDVDKTVVQHIHIANLSIG